VHAVQYYWVHSTLYTLHSTFYTFWFCGFREDFHPLNLDTLTHTAVSVCYRWHRHTAGPSKQHAAKKHKLRLKQQQLGRAQLRVAEVAEVAEEAEVARLTHPLARADRGRNRMEPVAGENSSGGEVTNRGRGGRRGREPDGRAHVLQNILFVYKGWPCPSRFTQSHMHAFAFSNGKCCEEGGASRPACAVQYSMRRMHA
jgi:hypothetical protein